MEAQDVTLFRKQSVSAARRRLLGPVCIITPPAAVTTLFVALLSLIVLAAVVYIVEVPQRTRAIGVLMPAGGLLNVIATDTGQITDLAVKEGMTVHKGQRLLRITSDRNAPGRSPVSASEIRSLRAELSLMQRVHDREQAMKSGRASELKDQIDLTGSRLQKADIEVRLQASHVLLLEERLERMTVLASRGSVANDVLAQERSALLHARSIAAGLDREILKIRQELKSLQAKRAEILESGELAKLQYDMEREKLLRQIRWPARGLALPAER
jgi:membrane fusion protein